MSPEELSDFKLNLDLWNYPDDSLVRKAAAHIVSQAAQIEALKKEADCSDIVQALEDAGIPMGDGEQDIITAIEILGSRIDAMKEKLVEERAKQFDVDEPCIGRTHFEFCELMDGSCDGYPHMWEACPRKKEKLEEARQQLKAEMPEVEW